MATGVTPSSTKNNLDGCGTKIQWNTIHAQQLYYSQFQKYSSNTVKKKFFLPFFSCGLQVCRFAANKSVQVFKCFLSPNGTVSAKRTRLAFTSESRLFKNFHAYTKEISSKIPGLVDWSDNKFPEFVQRMFVQVLKLVPSWHTRTLSGPMFGEVSKNNFPALC